MVPQMAGFPKLELVSQQLYAEPADKVIPRLLDELGTPFLVAIRMGVYPGSIRNWLLKNGYRVIEERWQRVERAAPEITQE